MDQLLSTRERLRLQRKIQRQQNYWVTRASAIEEEANDRAINIIDEWRDNLQRVRYEIDRRIDQYYQRYADENGLVSRLQAEAEINNREREELRWTVEEYIARGQRLKLGDTSVLQQMRNASARVHISREEALLLQVDAQLEVLYAEMHEEMNEDLIRMIQETYEASVEMISNVMGLDWSTPILNPAEVKEFLKMPWTLDRRTFSDRIWTQKRELLSSLQRQLFDMTIGEYKRDEVADKIAKDFNTSMFNASRLVTTEYAYFTESASAKSYEDMGADSYMIIATLDNRTSDICRMMNGKKFKLKDRQVGLNYPPFHPNCRTTVSPVFSNLMSEEWLKTVREAERDPKTGKWVIPD